MEQLFSFFYIAVRNISILLSYSTFDDNVIARSIVNSTFKNHEINNVTLYYRTQYKKRKEEREKKKEKKEMIFRS